MPDRGLKRSLFLFVAVLALTVVVSGLIVAAFRDGSTTASRDIGLERRVGDLVRKVVLADAHVVEEPVVTAAMSTIVTRLRPAMPSDPYIVTVVVADSGRLNAYSLPGGLIIVDASVLTAASSPEDVAAIIAHELSHMAHADAWHALQLSLGTSVVLSSLGGADAVRLVRDLARQGAMLSFSRDVETRADADAAAFLAYARIAPSHLASALVTLRDADPDRTQLPELLASHPDIDARIERARGIAFQGPEYPLALDWPAVQAALPSVLRHEE